MILQLICLQFIDVWFDDNHGGSWYNVAKLDDEPLAKRQ